MSQRVASTVNVMPVQQAKQIAEDLLQWIKALGSDRHKLIIQVPSSYSDKNGTYQSMRASSLANRSSAPSKNVVHIQTSHFKPSRNAYEEASPRVPARASARMSGDFQQRFV